MGKKWLLQSLASVADPTMTVQKERSSSINMNLFLLVETFFQWWPVLGHVPLPKSVSDERSEIS